jgi:signal transduction histidine kinase
VRRIASIRVRTTLAACAVVAIALVVGEILVLNELRRSLIDNVDRSATSRAEDVVALVRQDDRPPEIPAEGDEGRLVQVVDQSGRVIASSADLLLSPAMTTFRPRGTGVELRTLKRLELADDEDMRLAAVWASTPSGARRIVYAAARLESASESVTDLRRLLMLGLPVLVGLVGATAWVIVGRALRPVEAIRVQVAEFSDRDLTRRVPEPPTDDEVGRLATTMNAMLDRLQRFAERQRTFVADASHELQSPIASSRAGLEVAIARPESTDWSATAAELLEDNERMERLVRDLLFLVRAEDPAAVAPHTSVDLDDVVLGEVARLRSRARTQIVASPVSAVEVNGSADQLRRVVRNLLENADRHATSRVTVEVRGDGDWAEIVVTDDGPGVPVEARDRIFERFTRLDDSRSRATGGAGLGLAIAKQIVDDHRGTISVEPVAHGARFVVRLPCHG